MLAIPHYVFPLLPPPPRASPDNPAVPFRRLRPKSYTTQTTRYCLFTRICLTLFLKQRLLAPLRPSSFRAHPIPQYTRIYPDTQQRHQPIQYPKTPYIPPPYPYCIHSLEIRLHVYCISISTTMLSRRQAHLWLIDISTTL